MFETLNEIALPVVHTGMTWFTLAGEFVPCGPPAILSNRGEAGGAGLLVNAGVKMHRG